MESSSQQQSQQITQQPQQPMSDTSSQQSGLAIRLLMQGKEAGSIIGKKGDNIKRFRETSGAKINVSDSSCPDRIVTLSGTLDEVYKALSMICSKLEEQIMKVNSTSPNLNSSPLSNSNNASGHSILGNSSNSVMVEPALFGLPSAGIVSSALKEGQMSVKDAELHTMNNNCTSTINNNDISAPNKNLSSSTNKNSNSSTTSNNDNSYRPIVTLRLIIPASQCGSLIGRSGSKIKEIRELTSATIQVAPDVLPNSTERVVTISGNVESLRKCTYQICIIVLESPPKGYTIPFRPKPALTPMLLAAAASAGQAAAAYNLPGQFSLTTHLDTQLHSNRLALAAAFNPPANMRANTVTTPLNSSIQEMVIPNGLIGCVIGKGGSKINEIRQLSGATIKISNSEEGTKHRTITMAGTPEAITLAQYLINAR